MNQKLRLPIAITTDPMSQPPTHPYVLTQKSTGLQVADHLRSNQKKPTTNGHCPARRATATGLLQLLTGGDVLRGKHKPGTTSPLLPE